MNAKRFFGVPKIALSFQFVPGTGAVVSGLNDVSAAVFSGVSTLSPAAPRRCRA